MRGAKRPATRSSFPCSPLALPIAGESTQIISSAADTKFQNFALIENLSPRHRVAVIKSKVEDTQGERFISTLFASLGAVLAAIAGLVGRVSLPGLLFPVKTTNRR
jgi:hypothetical protein